ncbi:hypothetical protein K501DRAFT_275438 [Backusella circina FSU 941]|nr:hypothetical protein K501DRAFT_275438 [Backusella circina FSU 941]
MKRGVREYSFAYFKGLVEYYYKYLHVKLRKWCMCLSTQKQLPVQISAFVQCRYKEKKIEALRLLKVNYKNNGVYMEALYNFYLVLNNVIKCFLGRNVVYRAPESKAQSLERRSIRGDFGNFVGCDGRGTIVVNRKARYFSTLRMNGLLDFYDVSVCLIFLREKSSQQSVLVLVPGNYNNV